MKLSIRERYMMPCILPQQGSYLEMILINSIEEIVKITPKEITEYSIKEEENAIRWNEQKDVGMEFHFTPEQIQILKDSAKRVDNEKKVNKTNLSLITKINNI